MSFQLVPKSVILNDLERRNGVILRYFSEFGSLPGALRKSSCSLSRLLMSSCFFWQEYVRVGLPKTCHSSTRSKAIEDSRHCSLVYNTLFTARLKAKGCQSAGGNADRREASALHLHPSLRCLPLTNIPRL